MVPDAVLASLELASAILDALADPVVVYDAAGHIVCGNAAAATMFGLTDSSGQVRADLAESVAARRPSIALWALDGRPLPYEEQPSVRVLRGEILTGKETVDVHARAADGAIRILSISGAPLYDEDGRMMGAVCVCRDITESKRLEQEVAARAAEMESIFATQAEAVVFADSTGRIIRMNEAQRRLCTLAGVDPEAEYIQSWPETVAQYDAFGQPIVLERRPFYRALRGETVAGDQAVELYQRSSQGHELVLRVSGMPVRNAGGRILGVVLTSEDVTEHRLLERELAERASQLEGLFEAMTDGVILVDARGRIVRMNEAERQLVGYDPTQDGPGSLYADFAARRMPRDLENRPLPKEEWPAVRLLRGEALMGADGVEIRVRALDGRELILQLNGGPVRDAAGNILGAVVAVRDVTERHLLEEQRSDILRVVAHDLLTPVTGLRLYLQTQERRQRKGQAPFLPGEEHFKTLNANLLRMERLVNDLREMARIESGALTLEKHPCDLRALCRKEVEVQEMLTPGRTIQLVLPEEPIVAEVDEQRIGQVVANLLSNALKYSPIGHPVKLTLHADDAAIRVAVKDKGPGIPDEELDHIWERYHRVKRIKAHEGTQSLGLGLFICQAIIKGHGGQIGVESTVGVGSTFWFTLPLAQASTCGEPPG